MIGLPETLRTVYNLARRGGEVGIVGIARFDAGGAARRRRPAAPEVVSG